MNIEPYAFDRNGVPFEFRFEGEFSWIVHVYRYGIDTGERTRHISVPLVTTGLEMEHDDLRHYLIAAGNGLVDLTTGPDDKVH